MQDVHRDIHNDMPMDVYQQSAEVSAYSIEAHHEGLCNDLVSQQGREYYGKPDAAASSQHRVTLDHCDEVPLTGTNEFPPLDDQSTRSSSGSSKGLPMDKLLEHSIGDPGVLSDDGKGLQARVNSTSKPATFISPDLASTLASAIADRLGFSSKKECQYKTKEDVERAIHNSVTNLLGSTPSSKNVQALPATDATDAERLFKCEFCSKRKKTQCDLT
jgi:hypothetical protein